MIQKRCDYVPTKASVTMISPLAICLNLRVPVYGRKLAFPKSCKVGLHVSLFCLYVLAWCFFFINEPFECVNIGSLRTVAQFTDLRKTVVNMSRILNGMSDCQGEYEVTIIN